MRRMNVQAVVRKKLAEALAGVEVRTSVPADRPAKLVVVRREGGAAQNQLLDAPGIGVDVWAPSEAEACELCMRAADEIMSLTFAEGFALVTEEVMASQYDQLTDSPHWYASYSLITYKPIE